MRSDVVPGKAFPNYELPDHTGKARKLSEQHFRSVLNDIYP